MSLTHDTITSALTSVHTNSKLKAIVPGELVIPAGSCFALKMSASASGVLFFNSLGLQMGISLPFLFSLMN